jgi:glyoxylase-like metal-dependent hydrolase (beta-lactamase superfamily II)
MKIAVRTATAIAVLALGLRGALQAQAPPSFLVSETPTRVSDHVWALIGFPNIGIVVGSRATLVVDTGLGPRNGATIARVAAGLSKTPKLFLTTTHYHPEHASGESGFPSGTVLIRNAVQQQEAAKYAPIVLDNFRARNAQFGELLAGVTSQRSADILFDREATLDLGDVTAKLMWLGEDGHTHGDELIFVEPDGTLISGDIVQNKMVPGIIPFAPGDGGTFAGWLAQLDKLAKLDVKHVLPDHSPEGDGSLVGKERAFLADLRTRALALKREGVAAADAGKQLGAELHMKYPDWPSMNVANFVQRIYEER